MPRVPAWKNVWRSTVTTVAPSLTNRVASARPMPDAPPAPAYAGNVVPLRPAA